MTVTPEPVAVGRSARLDVIAVGYARRDPPQSWVGSSVTLLRDGEVSVVVDPGFVASQTVILDGLRRAGVMPAAITDVVLSHHHPDHTINAGLFPDARIHDHWAVYHHDRWLWLDSEMRRLAPSIVLLKTPGHTMEDITTLAGTEDGVYALTHLWWTSAGPPDDPHTPDRDLLRRNRQRVAGLADIVVPGHGPQFTVTDDIPL